MSTRIAACLLLAALALIPSGVRAATDRTVIDDFVVNAQYRGAVKKGVTGIGSGYVDYEGLDKASFRVEVKGTVRHPEHDREYAFKVTQTFRVAGNQIHLIEEQKKLNDPAREQEQYIIQIVPFSYIARFMPPPHPAEEPVRSFLYKGSQFDLRYRRTAKQTEIELYKDNWNVGKFFLAPDWRPGHEGFEKFRIPFPHENIMVSFVVSGTRDKSASVPTEAVTLDR